MGCPWSLQVRRIPQIIQLEYIGPGRCSAILRWPDNPRLIATTFLVQKRAGIDTISAAPDFLMEARGSATDIRAVYNLVLRFVRQAEGGRMAGDEDDAEIDGPA
jgi:hypothetical protein